MGTKQINKALNSLTTSILNDIIEKIDNLDLEKSDKEKVKSTVKNYNQTKKRQAPKIPLEKQCTETCKNGTKCTVPMCYNKVCWAHMSKTQREEYRINKEIKVNKI